MAKPQPTKPPKPTPKVRPASKKPTTRRIGKRATQALPKEKRVIGRPTLLTAKKIAAIAAHIESGNFAITACALEDISERAFYSWLEIGQRDDHAGRESVYTTFMQSIKKASALAESQQVRTVLNAPLGWQANMTWLERRFPDRWGQQSKLSMEEARTFIHKIMSVLASHIADRDVLETIVSDIRNVSVEKHERIN